VVNSSSRVSLKLNPTINDICKQLIEELEAIKEALEMGFEYLDHPLSYRQFKGQVAIVMKARRGFLKKKIEKNEEQP